MKPETLKPMLKGSACPELSIVIPTYGRVKVLEQNIADIRQALHLRPAVLYEIVLVDDASPDATWQVICRLCSQWPEVKGLLLSRNCGQQNATLAGLRHSAGDTVITMDDDLKDNPEDIFRLLDTLRQGYDVVYGVPSASPAAPFWRRQGTVIKERLASLICHKPKHVCLTGFRAMNRATVERICLETRRHPYLSATILLTAAKIGQLPVETSRPAVVSGYSALKLARVLFWLVISYANIPLLKNLEKNGRQYQIGESIACA